MNYLMGLATATLMLVGSNSGSIAPETVRLSNDPRLHSATTLNYTQANAASKGVPSLIAGIVRSPINSMATIGDDMNLPHAGRPRGVPDHYNWVLKPRVGAGNNPKGFTALTAWGQVYEDATGNPATNTRVQIRNLKTFLLSRRTGRWKLIQNSVSVSGAAYREDYVNDDNQPADVRQESNQGVSVKAGNGYNFHFWTTTGRATIDPTDVGGVFVTVQARLILDSPARPDDRSQARYLLSVGGDYWLNTTARWDNFKTNHDIAMGRFKYVTSEWQAFNMTTLSRAKLLRNPPPLD